MGNFAAGEANKMIDAYVGRTTYTANAAVWVKLHLGDPGSAGTTSPAANTTRQQSTFGVAASAGAISNTTNIDWVSVPNSETYTHVSLWTDVSAGTFIGSDQLASPAAVTAGDTFRIATGDLDITIATVV